MAGIMIGPEEWLQKNQRRMFHCPYQPGQLFISKQACSKRHQMGQSEDLADLLRGDLFNYTYKRGLSLCRECSIGKKLALRSPRPNPAALQPNVSQEKPGLRAGRIPY
jgi:hypothetical protein